MALAPAMVASQTPSDRIDGCGRSGPRINLGQTGVLLGETRLTVTVPDTGTFFSSPGTPNVGPGPALFICHVESGSSILIDARTGEELSRTVGDPSGCAVLDELAANARIEAVPDPIPASGKGLQPVTPPVTGSGGLKAQRSAEK
jgi:hypothetical protein